MVKNTRCPSEHVLRLRGLGCPLAEIMRISGYTAREIEAIINAEILRTAQPPAKQTQFQAERQWIEEHQRGEKA